MRQLQFFTTAQLATMRDRTARRNYSPEADEFRRVHEVERAWGLKRRHAEKLRRLRSASPDRLKAAASGTASARPSTPPRSLVAGPPAAPPRSSAPPRRPAAAQPSAAARPPAPARPPALARPPASARPQPAASPSIPPGRQLAETAISAQRADEQHELASALESGEPYPTSTVCETDGTRRRRATASTTGTRARRGDQKTAQFVTRAARTSDQCHLPALRIRPGLTSHPGPRSHPSFRDC